jgi:hypothetical protein
LPKMSEVVDINSIHLFHLQNPLEVIIIHEVA